MPSTKSIQSHVVPPSGGPAPQALECGGKTPLSLPVVALSVRQPWAWLIVNGFKDMENRPRCLKNFLGPCLIHASATMTHADYEACLLFVSTISALLVEEIPDPSELHHGGIVGQSHIFSHGNWPMKSPWWTGPYNYQFRDGSSKPLPFTPCKGRPGFFQVPESVISNLKSQLEKGGATRA